jgi:carbonic anhydrase/acetyltransferase-like protein (isoleucine patch superfamily)
MLEGLEGRLVLSEFPAPLFNPLRPAPPGYLFLIPKHRPVVPPNANPIFTSYVDPTVSISRVGHAAIAGQSFVAPFARLVTGRHRILIGQGSNIQSDAVVDSTRGDVKIGDNVAIGQRVTITGPSTIGGPGGPPVFVGLGAVIDGATIEPNTFISQGAKIGPGVAIHRGTKVLPGANIQTQQQADDVSLGLVTPLTTTDVRNVASVIASFITLAASTSSQFQLAPNGP